MSEHTWVPKPGEGPHGEYAEQCSECGMWDADMAADKECPGAAIHDSDLAVAIGEHAFRAGYAAGQEDAKPFMGENLVDAAWSLYDPPEELKGRSL